ncbi:Uncharacterised protein [Enterobacter cloacae]|nr:Uncharacterised protein [Enterobacter cloacae]
MFAVIHLDQAQLRVVRAGTDKFRIQGDSGEITRHLAQRSQLVVGSDHLVIQIGPRASSRNSRRNIFPTLDFGSSSRNSTNFGTL